MLVIVFVFVKWKALIVAKEVLFYHSLSQFIDRLRGKKIKWWSVFDFIMKEGDTILLIWFNHYWRVKLIVFLFIFALLFVYMCVWVYWRCYVISPLFMSLLLYFISSFDCAIEHIDGSTHLSPFKTFVQSSSKHNTWSHRGKSDFSRFRQSRCSVSTSRCSCMWSIIPFLLSIVQFDSGCVLFTLMIHNQDWHPYAYAYTHMRILNSTSNSFHGCWLF